MAGPYSSAAARDAEDQRLLAVARQELPGWDFIQVFAGWLGVPAGTPVIVSTDLEGVIDKLRGQSPSTPT